MKRIDRLMEELNLKLDEKFKIKILSSNVILEREYSFSNVDYEGIKLINREQIFPGDKDFVITCIANDLVVDILNERVEIIKLREV